MNNISTNHNYNPSRPLMASPGVKRDPASGLGTWGFVPTVHFSYYSQGD